MSTPPDSEEPETTREKPQAATGGLDPTPPNPGATVGLDPTPPDPGVLPSVAPHAFLVAGLLLATIGARDSALHLVCSVLLLTSAWAAWLLVRLDRRHRPIALGLVAMSSAQLVRALLRASALGAGPHAGWGRVAFYLDEGLYLLSTVALPWMAFATLRKRPYPPGPSPFARLWWPLWIAGMCVWLVVGYPELRGDDLRKVYLGHELVALLVACVFIAAWVRRRDPVLWFKRLHPDDQDLWNREFARGVASGGPFRAECRVLEARLVRDEAGRPRWYMWAPIVWLVAGDLLLLGVGAWRYGLFGAAYEVQQAGLLVVWGTVAAMQCAALVGARRGR